MAVIFEQVEFSLSEMWNFPLFHKLLRPSLQRQRLSLSWRIAAVSITRFILQAVMHRTRRRIKLCSRRGEQANERAN